MFKHPLFWGVLAFVISILGWLVSVIFSVVTLGHFRALANAFGYFALWVLPVTIVWELILWLKRRK